MGWKWLVLEEKWSLLPSEKNGPQSVLAEDRALAHLGVPQSLSKQWREESSCFLERNQGERAREPGLSKARTELLSRLVGQAPLLEGSRQKEELLGPV